MISNNKIWKFIGELTAESNKLREENKQLSAQEETAMFHRSFLIVMMTSALGLKKERVSYFDQGPSAPDLRGMWLSN